MLIKQFFENQEIFVTGGSGFIGKGLIEKLLRSCPGISKIYVLIRSKKGKNANERLLGILKSSLFDRLRNEQPSALLKVFAIEGDCNEVGLAIQPKDLNRIKNVNIIYHSAASVRFDDHLRDAILLNTRGTYEVIKLAEKMKFLKVFVHVSTTYCNPDKYEVDEKIYPPYADWRDTIKIAESFDRELLNTLEKKYTNYQPNTYTFTKSLSEQIVNDYINKLPIIIFRPSIVVSSLIEPVPGWLDNFNGPIGLLVACGIGILRTSHGDPDILSDFVPVDIVARCMIVATYYKGMEGKLVDINESLDFKRMDVVNCATGNMCPISTGQIIEIGKQLIKQNPLEKTLWVPGGSITKCRIWNLIRFIFLHIFVAILVDGMLRLSSSKPFLLRLQRRIFAANLALHYFATRTWEFKNDNFYLLHDVVPSEEVDVFGYVQFSDVKHDAFFREGIRGAKIFLLNEPAETSSGARFRLKIFEFLDFFFKFTFYLFLIRFVTRFIYRKYF